MPAPLLSPSLLAWLKAQVGNAVVLHALSKLTQAFAGIPILPRRPGGPVMTSALKEHNEKRGKNARRQSRRERHEASLVDGGTSAALQLFIPVRYPFPSIFIALAR